MSLLNGLGRAIRWLRDQRNKRQYQVADEAGITKAMLSAYETGKQKPSLDTLEKILTALGCDLNELHNALQTVNNRPELIRRSGTLGEDFRRNAPEESDPVLDLYRILGPSRKLATEEERSLSQMLEGYHNWIRYLHSKTPQSAGSGEAG